MTSLTSTSHACLLALFSLSWDGVPACDDKQAGTPCQTAGETCDFQSNCNALLICAAADPKQQVGGCPISRARFKQNITYAEIWADPANDRVDLYGYSSLAIAGVQVQAAERRDRQQAARNVQTLAIFSNRVDKPIYPLRPPA